METVPLSNTLYQELTKYKDSSPLEDELDIQSAKYAEELLDLELLERVMFIYGQLDKRENRIRITAKGKEQLRIFDEVSKKNAEEEAEKRLQREKDDNTRRKDSRRAWIILIIGIFVSIFCVLLGAFLSANTSWFTWLSTFAK